MNSLILPPTFYTPKVCFHPDGNLFISGRAMTTKTCLLFEPIFNWLEQYEKAPASETILSINLAILHVDCLVKLMNLFRLLEAMTNKGHNVMINWYCDKEDEDMQEMADMVSEILKAVPVTRIMIEKEVA